jgi:SAM-dependent methyltransferase
VDESKKSSRYFSELEQSILKNSVLDVGAGKDPVVPHADVFDLAQGDANHVTRYLTRQYDCVYSSHCLEHMRDPHAALREWWSLVKPGGWLFFIVPDEDLYEQGVFPSRFNGDHKFTFTLAKKKSWSPVSVNILDLVRALPDSEIVNIALNDIGYDRRLQKHGPFRGSYLSRLIARQIGSLKKRGIRLIPLRLELFVMKHVLIDQTRSEGLAQIEVVLKKKTSPEFAAQGSMSYGSVVV